MATSRQDVLRLYRQLLWHAKRFPSIKRDAIYEDIRIEFREKRGLAEPAKLRHAIEVAVRGLGTMSKYTTGLDKSSSEWSVTLEQDPLGAGEAQARAAAAGPKAGAPAAERPVLDAGVSGTIVRLY